MEVIMNYRIQPGCVFILILLVFAGCTSFGAGGSRFASDGLEMPPGVSSMKASDAAEATINQLETSKKVKAVVTLHVVGRGIAPENAINKGQAIILGQSAARSNGYVKLAEKIHGVYVDSFKKMGRGIVDVETVHQETQAWLRGAEVLEYKQAEYGIFEAYMRVRIIVNQDHALFPVGT
jgi:hypothetical protein